MIRVNLLGVERQKARKPLLAIDPAQSVTLLGALIFVVTAAGLGWWFWSLRQESAQLDADIAAAQQESARLQPLLLEVQQFEQQRERVRERVGLIEQLRRGQSLPVQLLDHVSRSVPDMLWLTSMTQQEEVVTIEGRSTTLIALSDFVGNLAGHELLRKPIEIVNSQVQPASGSGASATPELIQFTVRAQINRPEPPQVEAPAGRGARGRATGARGGARGRAAGS